MSADSERYRAQQHAFIVRAESCTPEIGAMWLELAGVYRVLADRQERLEQNPYAGLTLPRE